MVKKINKKVSKRNRALAELQLQQQVRKMEDDPDEILEAIGIKGEDGLQFKFLAKDFRGSIFSWRFGIEDELGKLLYSNISKVLGTDLETLMERHLRAAMIWHLAAIDFELVYYGNGNVSLRGSLWDRHVKPPSAGFIGEVYSVPFQDLLIYCDEDDEDGENAEMLKAINKALEVLKGKKGK